MVVTSHWKSPQPLIDFALNILKDGFESKVTGLPEDADLMQKTFDSLYDTLKPMNTFDVWVVQEMAITTMRIDRCSRIDRRLRDRHALRAQSHWDDDGRTDAINLGAKLGSDPERVADRLRKTPHGCDWMIQHWSMLAYIGDTQPSITPEQKSMAFDLLGTPKIFRVGEPGVEIDSNGRATVLDLNFSSMARRQIAGLRARRDEVAPADNLDRSLAAADVRDPDDPEFRSNRRYASSLHHRLRWLKSLLPVWSQTTRPYTHLRPDFTQEPKAAEKAEATQPDVKSEPEAEVEDSKVEELPAVEASKTILNRVDARLEKADRRREAKSRKLERRRA